MFTGIIEEIGVVQTFAMTGSHAQLSVTAQRVLTDLKIGDSIAVDGACLTATRVSATGFTADVSEETLHVTTLSALQPGARVNLERALRLSDRLGGHLVQGHVDHTAQILDLREHGATFLLTVSAPANIRQYIVRKGSIAIDGISLTVNQCDAASFTCMIIPHTIQQTTLQFKRPGDLVNLESDLIGRYVEQLMHSQTTPEPESHTFDIDILRKHGWITA